MATLAMVEKLREKANVTYDEAKEALNASGDDLLEAMIYLEKKGKVTPPPTGGYYNSAHADAQEQAKQAAHSIPPQQEGESFGDLMKRFFQWCGKILKKGCENMFQVQKGGNTVVTVPILVLILLLIFCFWITLPLLVIGLFFDCRYRFVGKETEDIGINNIMDSAANAAETLKQDIKNTK